MNSLIAKRALVLIQTKPLFFKIKNTLENWDWNIEDFMEEGDDCITAFVDRSYQEVGTINYLKEKRFKDRKVFFVLEENEAIPILSNRSFEGVMDDILIIRQREDENDDPFVLSAIWGEMRFSSFLEKHSLAVEKEFKRDVAA